MDCLLESIGLGDYVHLFTSHNITPELVIHLTENDITALFTKIGDRCRLRAYIKKHNKTSLF